LIALTKSAGGSAGSRLNVSDVAAIGFWVGIGVGDGAGVVDGVGAGSVGLATWGVISSGAAEGLGEAPAEQPARTVTTTTAATRADGCIPQRP